MKTQSLLRDWVSENIKVSSVMPLVWGISFLVLCSRIVIPIQPVPISLQPWGVLLLSLVMPRQQAFTSVLGYLALGVCGAPIFAKGGSGAAYLLGPTGGYLIGFAVCAWCVGWLRQRWGHEDRWIALTLYALSGQAIIYTCGVSWLFVCTQSLEKSLQWGLWPFVLPGFVKGAVLVGFIRFWRCRRTS